MYKTDDRLTPSHHSINCRPARCTRSILILCNSCILSVQRFSRAVELFHICMHRSTRELTLLTVRVRMTNMTPTLLSMQTIIRYSHQLSSFTANRRHNRSTSSCDVANCTSLGRPRRRDVISVVSMVRAIADKRPRRAYLLKISMI